MSAFTSAFVSASFAQSIAIPLSAFGSDCKRQSNGPRPAETLVPSQPVNPNGACFTSFPTVQVLGLRRTIHHRSSPLPTGAASTTLAPSRTVFRWVLPRDRTPPSARATSPPSLDMNAVITWGLMLIPRAGERWVLIPPGQWTSRATSTPAATGRARARTLRYELLRGLVVAVCGERARGRGEWDVRVQPRDQICKDEN
ncbi:hypothetical protein HWV62_33238 [Athelia sp. TMB]|nr:hypothetical protein HWV62_33238 [Athelia sp. TMB]